MRYFDPPLRARVIALHLSSYPCDGPSNSFMPRRGRKGKSLREIPRAGRNEARINWAGIMFARQGWHLLGRGLFLPRLILKIL